MSSTANELYKMQEYNKLLTDYVNELRVRAGDNMLDYFAELRGFPMEVIKEQDIFYIGDAAEMLIPRFYDKIEELGVISPTNKKPIFHNRFIMPIKTTDGLVQNLVGYSKEADERYVYGTAKYYRRRETMYGLENLKLAYKLGYAFLTEGITDTLRVRSLGYKNCFAMCGTHESSFIMKQLNRCENGVIEIPDRDKAGQKAAKRWECNRKLVVNTFIKYKDIDGMCAESKENEAWVKSYLDACVDWVLQAKHNGLRCGTEVVTMY